MNPKLVNPYQRQIEAARAAGYSDSEISQFLGARLPKSTPTPAPQPAKKKNNNFLSSLISEGGAAGGAALGTAILPGVGTLLGAGLGGFIGRLTENQVRDDRWGLGDAAKEGALSSAFAGVGPAFKAVKGAGTAARAGGSLEDALLAAKSGFTSAPKVNPSKLTKASDSLKSRVINPQTKASVFGAGEDDAIAKIVDKYVKGGTAARKYNNLETAFNGLSDDIQRTLKPVTRKTSTVDFTQKLTKSLSDDINFVPGDTAYERELGRVLNKVANFGKNGQLSASDIFEAKKYLNSQLKGAFGKNGADLTVPQQVRMAVWERLDDTISELAPKVKELTKAQSMLIKSADGLKKSSEKSIGIPLLGVKSKLLQGGVQRTGYTTANALGKAGALADTARPLTKAATPQIIGRGFTGSYELNSPINQSTTDTAIANTMMPANSSNMNEQYQSESNMSSPVSRESALEAMIIDIQTTGGKNLEKIKAIYEFANPEGGTASMSQSSRNALASSDNAINTVDQLEQLFTSAGSGSGRIGGTIKSLAADAGFDEDAKVYTSLANASVTQIAKALAGSGAGTVSDMDAKVIMAALPTLRDTPAEARAKFAALRQRLETAKNNSLMYGGGAGAEQPGSLEDALMQFQFAQ